MNKEQLIEEIRNNYPKENKLRNIVVSFFGGGIIAVIGVFIYLRYIELFNLSEKSASLYTTLTFIFLASLFTGFGFFDKLASVMKSGVIVPITGFAHTMTASAMDFKKGGFIKGIGANIFKLTGSIILYGIVSAFLVAIIKGVFNE